MTILEHDRIILDPLEKDKTNCNWVFLNSNKSI